MPPRKNVNPDGNSQFDFSKAKSAIPFRTPNLTNRRPDISNLRNDPRMMQAGVASPWKAMAMFTAKLIRNGHTEDALTSLNAAMRVVMKAPRGPVATRMTRAVARGGMEEANSVLNGTPSTISYPGIRTVDASAYYRSMSQILGRYAGRLPLTSGESVAARAAGVVLKNQARLWRNIK
jgi:hypothetical protein